MEWSDVLDAVMMVCFGISWPFAIAKLLRSRQVHGLSLGFLVLVNCGYLAGIAAKFVRAHEEHAWPAWPTLIYAANALLVGVAIVLYLRFRDQGGEGKR